MLEFLKTPAGHAVFGVIVAVLLIFVIELNYKYFTKLVLDFIFALIAVIICSPVLIAGAAISKSRTGNVFEAKPYLGAKGKIITVRSFAGFEGGIKNLPKIFEVLCGKLSFVGVKLVEVGDGALMEDNMLERFAARPGIFCHLAVKGNESLTYEEMFELDARYAKKRELFYDILVVLKSLVLAIRGESSACLGETHDKSYAEVLLERGEITVADFEKATEYGNKALAEQNKASEFKKQRYK